MVSDLESLTDFVELHDVGAGVGAEGDAGDDDDDIAGLGEADGFGGGFGVGEHLGGALEVGHDDGPDAP